MVELRRSVSLGSERTDFSSIQVTRSFSNSSHLKLSDDSIHHDEKSGKNDDGHIDSIINSILNDSAYSIHSKTLASDESEEGKGNEDDENGDEKSDKNDDGHIDSLIGMKFSWIRVFVVIVILIASILGVYFGYFVTSNSDTGDGDCSLSERGCSKYIQVTTTGYVETTVPMEDGINQMVDTSIVNTWHFSIIGRGNGEFPILIIEKHQVGDLNEHVYQLPLEIEIASDGEPTGNGRQASTYI